MARLGYEVLKSYTRMVECAAGECDYAAAAPGLARVVQ